MVINEVLAFIQNKHNVMDDVSLVRICLTGFSAEAVEQAKKLLYESVDGGEKYISRRKDKAERDIEDIIRLIKNTSTAKLPIFVAKDLHKLPPVNFENIDVTRLLKDILNLQEQLRDVKETYATCEQLELLKTEFKYCKSKELLDCVTNHETYININKKRGAYLLDSGPMGMSFNNTIDKLPTSSNNSIDKSTTSFKNSIDKSPTLLTTAEREVIDTVVDPVAMCAPETTESPCVPFSLPQRCEGPSAPPVTKPVTKPVLNARFAMNEMPRDKDESTTNNNNLKYRSIISQVGEFAKSYAECIPQDGVWKDKKNDDEWKLVQYRRHRNQFIGKKGSASTNSNTKFKAADVKVPLFVSNVDKSVTEKDITDYILEKTQERVSLSRIIMKRDKGYYSYKVFVSKSNLGAYLNDNLWPSGISFRRFVVFKGNSVGLNILSGGS